MKRLLLILTILSFHLYTQILFAETNKNCEKKEEKYKTTVGDFKVVLACEVDQSCEFYFNSKKIAECRKGSENFPEQIKKINGKLARPFDEIIVMLELTGGNACGGQDIQVFGLSQKGASQHIGVIDNCGENPQVKIKNGKIQIVQPGGKPHHGDGYIPSEIHEIRNGKLVKIK